MQQETATFSKNKYGNSEILKMNAVENYDHCILRGFLKKKKDISVHDYTEVINKVVH